MGQVWWHKPLIPALGWQTQVDRYEFVASLIYIVNSKPAKAHSEILSVWEVKGEAEQKEGMKSQLQDNILQASKRKLVFF